MKRERGWYKCSPRGEKELLAQLSYLENRRAWLEKKISEIQFLLQNED